MGVEVIVSGSEQVRGTIRKIDVYKFGVLDSRWRSGRGADPTPMLI